MRQGPPARIGDRLEETSSSGRRMAKLIGQVIDVSKIAGDRLRLEPESLDLSALVQAVVARLREARAGGAPGSVALDCGQQVMGQFDPMHIEQVVGYILLR